LGRAEIALANAAKSAYMIVIFSIYEIENSHVSLSPDPNELIKPINMSLISD
jgi:hypothetical protein